MTGPQIDADQCQGKCILYIEQYEIMTGTQIDAGVKVKLYSTKH